MFGAVKSEMADSDRADVVVPVAAVAEKSGSFVNWEGRPGSFRAALAVPAAQSDLQKATQAAATAKTDADRVGALAQARVTAKGAEEAVAQTERVLADHAV